MRSRLTLAFGLLGVIVVAAFIAFRVVTINDLAEDDVRRQVQRDALVTATLLGQGLEADDPPPVPAALAPFALPDRHLTVTVAGRGSSEVAGPQWREEDRGDAVRASATVEAVTVEVEAPMREVDRSVAAALPSLLALGAALVVLAVVLGALVATGLSRPFQQLAGAANALARGRSDLRIPRTRISEARAIGTALEGGAEQLRESLRRERDLALRASHELRTPLTGLRLALHELTDRDDAPAELLEAAEVAARHVERLDRAVGEVLEDTRRHPVVAAAQLPVSLVAPALAQRWADTLALADVEVEAELLGDASLVITPGPVEQILDEVLAAVLAHRGRLARLVVDAEERHVRVTVGLVGAVVPDTDGDAARPLARARTVVEAVGGRMSGVRVEAEACGPLEPAAYVVEDVVGQVDDPVAGAALRVHVGGHPARAVGEVVGGARGEVDVGDDADLGEGLQGAVDGGEVDAGPPLGDVGGDLLHCRVTLGARERVDDRPARHRDAVPALAQRRQHRVDGLPAHRTAALGARWSPRPPVAASTTAKSVAPVSTIVVPDGTSRW